MYKLLIALLLSVSFSVSAFNGVSSNEEKTKADKGDVLMPTFCLTFPNCDPIDPPHVSEQEEIELLQEASKESFGTKSK